METTNANLKLSCEAVRMILDDGIPESDREALRAHIAVCADCRAETRLRLLTSQLSEEVPAGLNESIMGEIRAQRARETARLRFIRRIGTVAAAAVLVPAVLLLAPLLHRADTAAQSDAVNTVEETRGSAAENTALPDGGLPMDSPDENGSEAEVPVVLYSTAASGTAEEENQEKYRVPAIGEPEASEADPANTEIAVMGTAAVSGAPDYVGTKDKKQDDKTMSTMGTETDAVPREEADWYRVLRRVTGDAVLNAWMKNYTGESGACAAAACRELEVSRADFTAEAEALQIRFTDAELDAIFG